MGSSLGITVNTAKLADLFSVSERQIQRLVEAGVIDAVNNNEKTYKFDLETVVPQYSLFLMMKAGGIENIGSWAPGRADPRLIR